MRAVGRFIGKHRGHEEAAILRARIALAARRFRQAANLLAPFIDEDTPSRRICLLMADIEDGLERDIEAHGWREKARRAPGRGGLDGWRHAAR